MDDSEIDMLRPHNCVMTMPDWYDPDVVLPTVARALGFPRGAARWTFDPQS